MSHNLFDTLQEFKMKSGKSGKFYSLPALEKALGAKVSRLPVSIRIVLESVLRNCDGKKVSEHHIRELANWKAVAPRTDEIPFVVARIVLQDFTGVPLLCDLAAMRGVAAKMGKEPKVIEPLAIGYCPTMARSRLVLPTPFRPSTHITLPGWAEIETPRSACAAP